MACSREESSAPTKHSSSGPISFAGDAGGSSSNDLTASAGLTVSGVGGSGEGSILGGGNVGAGGRSPAARLRNKDVPHRYGPDDIIRENGSGFDPYLFEADGAPTPQETIDVPADLIESPANTVKTANIGVANEPDLNGGSSGLQLTPTVQRRMLPSPRFHRPPGRVLRSSAAVS